MEDDDDEETMDEIISKNLKLKNIQKEKKIEYNLVWGKPGKKRRTKKFIKKINEL